MSPVLLRIASFVLFSSATLAGSTDLVPTGSTWRYLDDGSDQGNAWRAPAFDDSGWSFGPAELGYGDSDEATVVSFGGDPDDKYVTTYFRHGFIVMNPAQFVSMRLHLRRDDGAVCYLNGVEVARSNMPAGTIGYLTFAGSTASGSEEDLFYPFELDTSLLVPGQNVLAVEIHQRTATSSDISFELRLEALGELAVSRGPYLQLGTPTGARVRWRTNSLTESRLWAGPAPGALAEVAFDAAPKTEHELALDGLAPGSTTYYAIGDAGGVLAGDDATHFLRTPPTPGSPEPFRAWVIGDSGTADANAAAVRDAYESFTGATPTDLWLMLGDNAYTFGTDEEYQLAVFEMYAEMLRKSVLWPTRGNHEDFPGVYYGIFTMPTLGEAGGMPSGTEAYYSFDHANVHFVCLDSEAGDTSVGGAMWTWLDADLASTAQDWIVAFWHHAPYTKGSHDSDTEGRLIVMRENLVPLLEDHGVDLVLCGHSHSYERSLLIDGHYGLSSSFGPQHVVNGGDGSSSGDGEYAKAAGAHAGAVYAVAGSSGKTSEGPLDHPIMIASMEILGSLVLDVDGGRMDVTFLTASGNTPDRFTILNESYVGPYCVANPHTNGCSVHVSGDGVASASDPAPFEVRAVGVLPNQWGVLFYGFAPASFPFSNGTRCVGAPIRRTAPQSSGGVAICGGTYTFDFNAWIQGGLDPSLTAGTVVDAQYWYRDPASAVGSGLSDALQFEVGP